MARDAGFRHFEREKVSSRLSDLWRLSPPIVRRAALGLAMLTMIAAVAELATLAALAAFLARIGQPSAELARLARLFGLAAITSAVIRLWLTVRTNRLSAGISHHLAVDTQRRLIHQPLAFHDRYNSVRALALLDKVQLIGSHVFHPVAQLGQSLMIGGAILVMLAVTTPVAGLIILALIALTYAIVARLSWRRIAEVRDTLATDFDQRLQVTQETMAGIRDIILESGQERRLGKFVETDRRLQTAMASIQNIAATPRLIVEGAGMALLALLVVVLAGRGLGLLVPVLGVIAFAALRLLPLAQAGFASWQSWNSSRGVTDDVLEILALPVNERGAVITPLPFLQSVELVDVSFGYDGNKVIDGVSLELPVGSRTGLVGPTGCGKSTLGDLLMGLRHPQSGRLAIDQRTVSEANAAGWQRNIAHVGQQLFLLDASIADNVALGDPSPDQPRIVDALRRAELGELVGRLDEPVGERGVRLSGGQRQRLGLARAFYKAVPFLLLDEATSALDEETERKVLSNIAPDCTVVIIAHRASALAICDRIYELRDGRLTERATV